MIGLNNKDSSFFTVESSDIKLEGVDLSKSLLSFSISEKSGGMPTGSLKLYDPKDIFSRILRTGVQLTLSWGYREKFKTPDSLLSQKLNVDEFSGTLIRRGLKGFVSSPQGGGDNKGIKTYQCNFTSYGFRGLDQSKTYSGEGKTRADVISEVFDDIGVSKTKRLIDFTIGSETIPTLGIRQDETSFLFINKLARDWRAFFQMGFSQSGEIVGIFIDPNKIGSTLYQKWTMGVTGKSNVLGYKGVLNNVQSFTWTSNEAESGVGDNVKLDIVDGQIIFRKFVAETKSVTTYRLDTKKINDVFDDAEGLQAQIRLTTELLSRQDFESIKHFFIPVNNSTAPMGAGYRVKCKMIGNPLFSPPNQIVINNGFPDVIGDSGSIWYIQSVTHIIDRSGYNMNIEIVDVWTLSPIGTVIR